MIETVQEQVQEAQENGSGNSTETSAEFFSKLVGISEAAAITGRNKGRISIDTNGQKLPFTLNEKGQKRYKVADLYQLYGFKNPAETVSTEVQKPYEIPTETLVELALLKQQVQVQTEQLRRADDEIRDLRQNRDKLIDQNNRLTLLLPPPPSAAPEPTTNNAPPSERKPFWKRFFA